MKSTCLLPSADLRRDEGVIVFNAGFRSLALLVPRAIRNHPVTQHAIAWGRNTWNSPRSRSNPQGSACGISFFPGRMAGAFRVKFTHEGVILTQCRCNGCAMNPGESYRESLTGGMSVPPHTVCVSRHSFIPKYSSRLKPINAWNEGGRRSTSVFRSHEQPDGWKNLRCDRPFLQLRRKGTDRPIETRRMIRCIRVDDLNHPIDSSIGRNRLPVQEIRRCLNHITVA